MHVVTYIEASRTGKARVVDIPVITSISRPSYSPPSFSVDMPSRQVPAQMDRWII